MITRRALKVPREEVRTIDKDDPLFELVEISDLPDHFIVLVKEEAIVNFQRDTLGGLLQDIVDNG